MRPERDAARRGDERARPRARRRGAERDPRARRGRHDDADRDARDGLRPRHREPRLLPRRGRHPRAGPAGADLQRARPSRGRASSSTGSSKPGGCRPTLQVCSRTPQRRRHAGAARRLDRRRAARRLRDRERPDRPDQRGRADAPGDRDRGRRRTSSRSTPATRCSSRATPASRSGSRAPRTASACSGARTCSPASTTRPRARSALADAQALRGEVRSAAWIELPPRELVAPPPGASNLIPASWTTSAASRHPPVWVDRATSLERGIGRRAPRTMNWSSSSARWGPQPTCRVSKDRVRRHSQCRLAVFRTSGDRIADSLPPAGRSA